jgi:hypothetical protein
VRSVRFAHLKVRLEMARRVFLSYQHEDQLKAKGFNLMRYNKHLGLEFVARGLLDPVRSKDPAYIRAQIREKLKGTSVTVVLLGDKTADSEWVANEIAWSIEKDSPNGLVGIKLTVDAEVPAGLEGAEILDWHVPEDVQEFSAAIERAALAARRMTEASKFVGSGSGCAR